MNFHRGTGEGAVDKFLKIILSEPVPRRRAEPLLPAVHKFSPEDTLEHIFQDYFPMMAIRLESLGKVECEFDQSGIEERGADFE